MSFSILSSSIYGLDVTPVDVEVDVSFGVRGFSVVGLPDRAIKESCGRVETAINNCDLPFPRYKITVNLAPASVLKAGPLYDLPIALGILMSEGVFEADVLDGVGVFGELGLDGTIRGVSGALPMCMKFLKMGIDRVIVPSENVAEAGLVRGLEVIGASHLKDVVMHLSGDALIVASSATPVDTNSRAVSNDFCDVRGQEYAKRACEIAAAGGHNLLFSGPPGSGKTMLARAMPGILPELTIDEVLEITSVHSIAGVMRGERIVSERPFISPHHTASGVALIGGGGMPRPGGISLAHRGVLFLDEFPEFSRHVLEHLRQPLEDGFVTVARARGSAVFPAKFMLVAAMNPCPCGYYDDPFNHCTCSSNQILQYQKRLSGPLMDRIDLHVGVPKIEVSELGMVGDAESSSVVRGRVQAARDLQTARYAGSELVTNADLGARDIRRFSRMSDAGEKILLAAAESLHVSARAYFRIIKVARTIADLAGEDEIGGDAVSEAVQYRFRPTV